MNDIKVLKRNPAGEATWQYDGRILAHAENSITLEAFFNRPDMPFMDVVFKENDRFVETFYSDRWYNVFEIHDRDDGRIKGWYCNIGRPALIADGIVSYVDLALDLWVASDGKQTILDEDEFDELMLGEKDRAMARTALAELQELFKSKRPPQ